MIDDLRNLLLIVEHRTFTAAARQAHLSQPALTASIHRLEAHFGARLLHRDRRGAALTAAGEALVPRIRAALAAIEDGRRAVAEVLDLRAGQVRLGAGATACTYLLPPALASFRRRHPAIRFILREVTTDEARTAIGAGELDLALVTAPEGELWYRDELILVAAPGVPPASAPFLTFRPGATTRALFDRHFPGADVVMELGSIAAVKGNVRAGIGMALVSRSAVDFDLRARRLRLVRHPATPIARELRLVHRGLDRLPPAAAALREHLLASPPVPAHRARRRAGSRAQAASRRAGSGEPPGHP
jgi:DNA-binding transcriptional LysR family regulator